MDGTLNDIFNLYEFTSGRRLFALAQVAAIAKDEGFTDLVKHCAAAIAHERAVRELERRWAGEPVKATNPQAQRIDALTDRTLTALRDSALAQAQGAPPGDPIHAQVEGFLKRIFPISVYAITSLGYVEELAAVDEIVSLLKGELAPTAKELGLKRLADRLADLASQYREALEAPPDSLVGWGRVRAARAEGQGMLLEAVALIVGRHYQRSAEGTAARLALLRPILQQNDAIGQYLKARRAVGDVNPDTGDEAPPPPAAEPTPKGPQ